MKKRKLLAIMLTISMIAGGFGTTSLAAEDEYTLKSGNQIEEIESVGDKEEEIQTEYAEELDEEKPSPQTIDENIEVSEKQQAFEYVYIDEQTVALNDEQNIVVAFADANIQLEYAVLNYKEIYSDKEYELNASKIVDNTVLFTKEYANEIEMGQYELESISYRIEGIDRTIEVAFAEQDIQVTYSVTAEDKNVTDIDGDTAEVSVYSLDEDGNTVEKTETTSTDITEAVEEALSGMESQIAVESLDVQNTRTVNQNKVIFLTAGHCSRHPGASGNGLREEQLTYKVAQYCKQELEKYAGVTVYTDRPTVDCAYPGKSSNYCLNQRVVDAAEKGANVFVDIHFNVGGGNGAEVYIPNNSYSTAIHQDGQSLGNNILNQLSSLGLKNRGTKVRDCTTGDKDPNGILEDYYTSINASKAYGMTGIIVEHAFLDSAKDAGKLKDESFVQQLGIADATGIANTYGLIKGNWKLESNGWKYQYEDGSYAKDCWLRIGAWYHFDKDGYMQTGWLTLADGKYYLNNNGSMLIGWGKLNNNWYYFDASGKMTTGWVLVNNKWYYMNKDGVMQAGWLTLSDVKYYLDSDGSMVIGWMDLDNKRYYFNASGKMEVGWLTLLNGSKYYFDKEGAMYVGKHTIDEKEYEFASDGTLKGFRSKNGWKQENNIWYYYVNDEKSTGWLNLLGTWYYMNESGAMATGWVNVNGTWYYMNESGAMVTGWANVNGIWYYMNESGEMITGWLSHSDGNKYYLGQNGAMYVGKHTIDGKECDFAVNGALKRNKNGWQKENNVWYYYANEHKTTGWLNLSGIWYYMNGSGAMVTGWVNVNGTWYYMNESGAMATGWVNVNGTWYYMNESGAMATGWVNVNGTWYYMNGSGAMVTGWVNVNGTWYYMNHQSGASVTGYYQIDGIWYYFNELGKLEYTGVTTIMGTSQLGADKSVVVNKLVTMYKKRCKTYPSEELKKGGAETIDKFCEILYEEAICENVKPEVVFAQAMKETGFLKFGGDVKIEQYNFAGLGALGNSVKGASFVDVKTGLRAQVQHLKAYASNDDLENECVDPRFKLVTRNTAPYVEWLGSKENPKKVGWATEKEYGISMMKLYVNPIYGL